MPGSTPLSRVEEFLSHRRLAMVGVSSNPRDFSRRLFREFQHRGYDIVPVNPVAGGDIEGVPAFATVLDIHPAPEGALLMTPPAVSEFIVHECQQARIPRVWMFRATGKGAVSQAAVRFCEAHAITVVAGECPLMFFPHTMWLHRMHGLVRRITGNFPS